MSPDKEEHRDDGQRVHPILEAYFAAHPERPTRMRDGEIYVMPKDCYAAIAWARERGQLNWYEATALMTVVRRLEDRIAQRRQRPDQDHPEL